MSGGPSAPALPQTLLDWRFRVESALREALSALREAPDSALRARLLDAMDDALRGGKRVRAMLAYAAARAVAGARSERLPVSALEWISCALESWHAYSLVHDDLPAMDDDDQRRGRPSCHKAHGEGIAILAGDALQTLAFEWLCRADALSPERRVRLVATLAECGGCCGVAGGQSIDLALVAPAGPRNAAANAATVHAMHRLKTAALTRGAALMGGIAAQAELAQLDALGRCGERIGMAFQLRDDALDAGEDRAAVSALDYREAAAVERAAKDFGEQAVSALAPFGGAGDELRALALFAERRSH